MLERRPVAEDDAPFLRELYASTRPDLALLPTEARDVILPLQLRAQRQDWTARFPGSEHDLIVLDGLPVGRTWVAWLEDECRIVDLSLLPAWRGRHVGSEVAEKVLGRADRDGLPVRLSVAGDNVRGVSFWERLGFAQAGGDGVYLAFERPLRTARPARVSRAPSR